MSAVFFDHLKSQTPKIRIMGTRYLARLQKPILVSGKECRWIAFIIKRELNLFLYDFVIIGV